MDERPLLEIMGDDYIFMCEYFVNVQVSTLRDDDILTSNFYPNPKASSEGKSRFR